MYLTKKVCKLLPLAPKPVTIDKPGLIIHKAMVTDTIHVCHVCVKEMSKKKKERKPNFTLQSP